LLAQVVAAPGLADGEVHHILVHPPAGVAGYEIKSRQYVRERGYCSMTPFR
jgi:hypothetical protein